MKMLVKVVVITLLLGTMTACDDKSTNSTTSTLKVAAPDTSTPAVASPMDSVSVPAGSAWAELTTDEKSVLSVLETQWPKISPDMKSEFIHGADDWKKMQPSDQIELKKKMYKELGRAMP